jgi:transcriptional regulator with XRE-family HTH domain
MPGKRNPDYDPVRFQNLLRRLLDKSGESYREAGLASGLSEATISNYMRETNPARPMRDICIALADHFGVNPNQLLEAAGYKRLDIFDLRLRHTLPQNIDSFVDELLAIEDEEQRNEILDYLRQMLHRDIEVREAAIEKGEKRAGEKASEGMAYSEASG